MKKTNKQTNHLNKEIELVLEVLKIIEATIFQLQITRAKVFLFSSDRVRQHVFQFYKMFQLFA